MNCFNLSWNYFISCQLELDSNRSFQFWCSLRYAYRFLNFIHLKLMLETILDKLELNFDCGSSGWVFQIAVSALYHNHMITQYHCAQKQHVVGSFQYCSTNETNSLALFYYHCAHSSLRQDHMLFLLDQLQALPYYFWSQTTNCFYILRKHFLIPLDFRSILHQHLEDFISPLLSTRVHRFSRVFLIQGLLKVWPLCYDSHSPLQV